MTKAMNKTISALMAHDYKPQRNGKGWTALCPGHDDHHPSLDISDGENGRVLLICRSHRCKPERIVEAIGLTMPDLFDPDTNMRTATAVPPSALDTYDYTDAEGVLLFQVVRTNNPDSKRRFYQRRPNGQGGWINNRKGVPAILYRLPGLLNPDPETLESFVFISEGERDVNRLVEAGMIATTNPGGVGKWKSVDDTPLHGRHVVILPDNDGPGRRHAAEVALDLDGKAAGVRVVELPGLPHKGDVSDWFDAGNGPEDLTRLAEATALYQRPAAADEKTTGKNRLATVRMSKVKPEQIQWLWPNRFPMAKLSIIGGMQGLGKSFITLEMASIVSTGRCWPDLPDEKIDTGSVVLLNLEDGLGDTIRPRLNRMGADTDRIVAVEGVDEIDHSGRRTFNIERDIGLLQREIKRIGDVRLVIIDPLTAYIGSQVNANQDNEVRAALHPLGELAEQHDVAVVGIMHLRKAPSDQALFKVLGSVAFTAYARAVWLIGQDRDEPDYRLMLPVKMNIAKAAPGMRFEIVEPGKVEWLGDTDIMADDIFATTTFKHPDEAGPKVQEAIDWLKQALANGPQRANDIKKQAGQNCIAPRTLERAKAKLGVVPSNEGVIGGTWFWSLPEAEW